MKDSIRMTKETEKGCTRGLMEISTMENLRIVKSMGSVLLCMLTGISLKVSMKTIKSREKVNLVGLMGIFMKGNMLTIKERDMVY